MHTSSHSILAQSFILKAQVAASSHAQYELLEAVLDEDVARISMLFSKRTKQKLLDGAFGVPIVSLALTSPSHATFDAFYLAGLTHGENIYPLNAHVCAGELAVQLCSPDRQKWLIDNDFLPAETYGFAGMLRPEPELFDIWSEAHFKSDGFKFRHNPHFCPVPDIVFHLQPKNEKGEHFSASPVQAEIERRRARLIDRFLDDAYPAQNEEDRWRMMMKNPPKPLRSQDAHEAIYKTKIILRHQLKKTPKAFDTPLCIALQAEGGFQMATALMQCGFSLAHFENNLVDDFEQHLSKMLSSPHNISLATSIFWGEAVADLKSSDPDHLRKFPSEMLRKDISLKDFIRGMSDDEKVSFSQALSLSRQTATAPNARPARPRL